MPCHKRKKPLANQRFFVSAPDWDRTSDLRLRKPTLFQLSYGYKKVRKDTRKSAFAQKNLCYFDLETQPQIQYNHAKSC